MKCSSLARPVREPRLRWVALLSAVALAGPAATGTASAAGPVLGQPDQPPAAAPPTIDAPAPTPALAPPAAEAAAAERARARVVQLARRDAARRERAATFRAVRSMAGGVSAASVAASRSAATSKSATRREASVRTASASPSPPGSADRASTLALALLALSGVTAGIALLPLRVGRSGHHQTALRFVERHRLELAGVSTSCLLVALLVFAGLI